MRPPRSRFRCVPGNPGPVRGSAPRGKPPMPGIPRCARNVFRGRNCLTTDADDDRRICIQNTIDSAGDVERPGRSDPGPASQRGSDTEKGERASEEGVGTCVGSAPGDGRRGPGAEEGLPPAGHHERRRAGRRRRNGRLQPGDLGRDGPHPRRQHQRDQQARRRFRVLRDRSGPGRLGQTDERLGFLHRRRIARRDLRQPEQSLEIPQGTRRGGQEESRHDQGLRRRRGLHPPPEPAGPREGVRGESAVHPLQGIGALPDGGHDGGGQRGRHLRGGAAATHPGKTDPAACDADPRALHDRGLRDHPLRLQALPRAPPASRGP